MHSVSEKFPNQISVVNIEIALSLVQLWLYIMRTQFQHVRSLEPLGLRSATYGVRSRYLVRARNAEQSSAIQFRVRLKTSFVETCARRCASAHSNVFVVEGRRLLPTRFVVIRRLSAVFKPLPSCVCVRCSTRRSFITECLPYHVMSLCKFSI